MSVDAVLHGIWAWAAQICTHQPFDFTGRSATKVLRALRAGCPCSSTSNPGFASIGQRRGPPGIERRAAPNLQHINLASWRRVSDGGSPDIERGVAPNLQHINLRFCQYDSDEGTSNIEHRAAPNLQHIKLDSWHRVSDGGSPDIERWGCPKFAAHQLCSWHRVSDGGFQGIERRVSQICSTSTFDFCQ